MAGAVPRRDDEPITGINVTPLLGFGLMLVVIMMSLGEIGCSGRAADGAADRPIELTLHLARQTWRVGQRPWYLLELRNLGDRPVTIWDEFWRDQGALGHNAAVRTGLFFDLRDRSGNAVPFYLDHGHHGENHLWSNRMDGDFEITLLPGKVFRPAPSTLAPLSGNRFWAPLAWKPPREITDGGRRALRLIRDDYQRELGVELDPLTKGLPGWTSGYRILEGYGSLKPGGYRLKAIYAPFGKDISHLPPGSPTLESRGWSAAELPLVFESAVVDFEVVPVGGSVGGR